MPKNNPNQTFEDIERETLVYSDVAASTAAAPESAASKAASTFSPKVQVTRGSAKAQAAFWAQLEEEAAQSEREIVAAYERRRAQAAAPEIAVAEAEPESHEAEGGPESHEAEAELEVSEAPEELSFAQHCDRLMEVLGKKPSHREIMLRTLSFCTEEREFSAVEAQIQSYPEYPYAGQNPYRLITFLIDGGGLEQLEIGFDGSVVTPECKEGLTEDEIDDLIDCFHLRTTDVGRAIAEDMQPVKRIRSIFSLFTDRQAYYTEIMEFCGQPRKFKEIEALFKGRDLSGVRTLHPEAGISIKPTVFVENLERAGAIVWKDGWVVTEEGAKFLEQLATAG